MSLNGGVRDIPGYYYDSENKKYFKIQPNAPSGSAYSFQDIKKRKIKNENQEARKLISRRLAGRVKRANILQAPLAGGFLVRELGKNHGETIASSIYAQNLVRAGTVTTVEPSLFAVTTGNPSTSLIRFHITNFADHRRLLVNCDLLKDARNRPNVNIASSSIGIRHSNAYLLSATLGADVFGHGQSTSICANHSRRKIATTWLSQGSEHSGIAISPISDVLETGYDFSEATGSPAQLLGPGRPETSIYSSTSAPSTSSYLFAFGTSNGILLVDGMVNGSWLSPEKPRGQSVPRDVFALDFLPDNESVLLSGGRNGILNITDIRLPQFGPEADTIVHPSCITHIKCLDDRRILVAGLESTLCQYDLRFRKHGRSSSRGHLIEHQVRRNGNPTRPALVYPEYKNQAQISIGFDVDLERGVIAAAQDYDNSVNIFSLHGGNILTTLGAPSCRSTPPRTDIDSDRTGMLVGELRRNRNENLRLDPSLKSLKFVQDMQSGPKSIWVAQQRKLERWAWENFDEN